jgi:hypothetical protein
MVDFVTIKTLVITACMAINFRKNPPKERIHIYIYISNFINLTFFFFITMSRYMVL